MKEKLTFNAIAGFALGFAGIIILVGWKSFSLTPSLISAVSAAMIAAFLYAVAAPYHWVVMKPFLVILAKFRHSRSIRVKNCYTSR